MWSLITGKFLRGAGEGLVKRIFKHKRITACLLVVLVLLMGREYNHPHEELRTIHEVGAEPLVDWIASFIPSLWYRISKDYPGELASLEWRDSSMGIEIDDVVESVCGVKAGTEPRTHRLIGIFGANGKRVVLKLRRVSSGREYYFSTVLKDPNDYGLSLQTNYAGGKREIKVQKIDVGSPFSKECGKFAFDFSDIVGIQPKFQLVEHHWKSHDGLKWTDEVFPENGDQLVAVNSRRVYSKDEFIKEIREDLNDEDEVLLTLQKKESGRVFFFKIFPPKNGKTAKEALRFNIDDDRNVLKAWPGSDSARPLNATVIFTDGGLKGSGMGAYDAAPIKPSRNLVDVNSGEIVVP